jgi:hypothetical protein
MEQGLARLRLGLEALQELGRRGLVGAGPGRRGVGGGLCAEVAVDEAQAVRHLVGEHRVGPADLGQDARPSARADASARCARSGATRAPARGAIRRCDCGCARLAT